MKYPEKIIRSLVEYIESVQADTCAWEFETPCTPWFRGQADVKWSPKPSIFREPLDEWEITDRFRKMAPMFGDSPLRDKRDEWLYLMQHVGVPTRLLDWSHGALVGLYFAVNDAEPDGSDPCVWVLHPLELNRGAFGVPRFPDASHPEFKKRCDLAYPPRALNEEYEMRPTYSDYRDQVVDRVPLPIAILPTHVHPRMASQKGCFTLHGSQDDGLEDLVLNRMRVRPDEILLKYVVKSSCAPEIRNSLRLMGIDHCSLFPDHDGLAKELRRVFLEFGKPGRGHTVCESRDEKSYGEG